MSLLYAVILAGLLQVMVCWQCQAAFAHSFLRVAFTQQAALGQRLLPICDDMIADLHRFKMPVQFIDGYCIAMDVSQIFPIHSPLWLCECAIGTLALAILGWNWVGAYMFVKV